MMALPLKHEDIDRKIGSDWVCEPKYDGMRLLLHFPMGKLTEALTRSGRDVLDRIPKLWVETSAHDLHRAYVETGIEWFDCEFGYFETFVGERSGDTFTKANFDFNKTMRIMGSGPDVAQAKAEEFITDWDNPKAGTDVPIAMVFDVPDMYAPLWERRVALMKLFELADQDYWYFGQGWGTDVPQWEGWHEANYTNIVLNGGEGVMVKNPHAYYHPGKRPSNAWYKVKKFDTFEAYVVGFDQGQGKYSDLIGAIVATTQDGVTIRCSGMTDDERIKITARQERIIQQQWVLEVKHFGLTAGTPRHPQFLRWREDKGPDDCWFQPKEQT
jgi:ATP-dependent DNA ligase